MKVWLLITLIGVSAMAIYIIGSFFLLCFFVRELARAKGENHANM